MPLCSDWEGRYSQIEFYGWALLWPYSHSLIAAFDLVTEERDAQDFRSPGLSPSAKCSAEVRLRYPRAADLRHRRNRVWADRVESGRSRCSGGRDARGPVGACNHGYQGSFAAPQNRAGPNAADRPGG